MGYYKPNNFRVEEIFSPEVIAKYSSTNIDNIWALMDYRALWTLERLRDRFGVTIVNDYCFGGVNKLRGYRSPIELIDRKHFLNTSTFRPMFSSFYSQHCLGRAIDCKFKNISAEEVRADIKLNSALASLRYIGAIELNVSWLHFDVRSSQDGIVYF